MADGTTIPELRQILAKTLKEKIETYKDMMLEMRQKELSKSNLEADILEKSHKHHKRIAGLNQKPDKSIQTKDATKARMAVQKIRSMTQQQVRAALNQKRKHHKSEELEKVAPPGREDQVRALKPKVGTASAFKIAWASYNQGRKHKVEKNSLVGGNISDSGMGSPMSMSEKSDPHEHLHAWVSDFADAGNPGDKRALKAYHRIKGGTHREGDVEHFHKWINQSADKDNSGDRKAVSQWNSLKANTIGVKKADEVSGSDARSMMQMEKGTDPSYLREEQGVPVPPKDSKSVARTTEKAEADPGKRDAKSKSSDLLNAPGILPCDAKPKPQDAKDTGSGTPDAPKPDKLGKVDVPMAKPPSGKAPGSAAPPMSKPKAPAAAAAPGAPAMLKSGGLIGKVKDLLAGSKSINKNAFAGYGAKAPGLQMGGVAPTAATMKSEDSPKPQMCENHPDMKAWSGSNKCWRCIDKPARRAMKRQQAEKQAKKIAARHGEVITKAIPGTPQADALSASHRATQAPPLPAPKMPSQAEHAQRAAMLSEHTPPGSFSPSAGLKSPMSAITAALHAPKPGVPVQGMAVMPPGAGVSKQPPHVELMGKVKAALGSKGQ